MGVDYIVVPLADKLARGKGAYLRRLPLALPDVVPEGRFPTYAEVVQALSPVEDWHVEVSRNCIGSGWSACVESGKRYAYLQGDEQFEGSRPGVPAFYFVRGWPSLVVEITERLSRLCGPFVVVSPDEVTIVWPGANPDQAWVSLYHPASQ